MDIGTEEDSEADHQEDSEAALVVLAEASAVVVEPVVVGNIISERSELG